MALFVFDRVKETSTTAGTGTIVLAGAQSGYQSFAVVGNANTTYYTIADQSGANWEVGIGTYYSGNVSLSRNTILASSNSNAAVSFGSNSKDVFITYPAEDAVYLNNGVVYAGASANVAFSNITASNAVITTGAFTNATVITTPTQSTDVVNKAYVDQQVSVGITIHAAVQVATAANLASLSGGTVTYNQPNGAANGVGATLTLSVALNSIGGYTLNNTDRVLVKNETNQTTNGVYTWATGGTVLTRATDADTYGSGANQLSLNDYFYVQNGTLYRGTSWVLDAPSGTITFGTSNLTFAEFSSAQIYSAGTGLTLTDTTFKISNTAVTSSTYGGVANVGTFTVNQQGQLTAASNVAIQIANTQVTGLGTMSTQNANAVAITGGTIAINDSGLTLSNAVDSTKKATFNVGTINTNNTIAYNLPISTTANTAVTLAGLNVAQTFTVAQTIGSGITFNALGSLQLTGSASSTTNLGTSATTGLLTIGGPAQTGTMTVGQSNATQTTNIQSGATTTGNTKTINIGANGTSGSFTNITIGSANGTNTSILGNLILTGTLTSNGSTGTSGQVLTSNGTSGSAYWATSSGGGGISPYANNSNSSIFVSNNSITGNVTIAVGQNGLTISPINIPSGNSISISNGQKLVII
jgi:hypothetical protein